MKGTYLSSLSKWEGMFFLEQMRTAVNKPRNVNEDDGMDYSEKQAKINSCRQLNMPHRGQVKAPIR